MYHANPQIACGESDTSVLLVAERLVKITILMVPPGSYNCCIAAMSGTVKAMRCCICAWYSISKIVALNVTQNEGSFNVSKA